MNSNKILRLALLIGIIGMSIPILICTLYTYPVQDDFFNTWNVRLTMQEGHSAFGAALLKAIEGWSGYSQWVLLFFVPHLFLRRSASM